MYQGHRPRAISQSDDSDQLRRHAHRLMTELQQLRNMHKQRVINIHERDTVSETTSQLILMHDILDIITHDNTLHRRSTCSI